MANVRDTPPDELTEGDNLCPHCGARWNQCNWCGRWWVGQHSCNEEERARYGGRD